MPVMRVDMIKGRSESQIKEILDIAYDVMLQSFGAPVGDRYQIVTQHAANEMQVLDTGLGFTRTEDVLVFSLTTRPRTTEQKEDFYHRLMNQLQQKVGLRPEDLVINLTINTDEDWSFGMGKAQFLTGDL
ncbi:tautomerase family protein [Dellaglioa algida]|uniref:tautomerase family protein n=1 Tax=Dellaglioa algida TaxID=105612 RepID=UPI000BD447F0|nr:tautomerase family protein [Dellaglioa algida]MDK1718753.1 tautomerase family protein [Dellaglioa algida]MDK1730326.1 tautomerase family protein [Dellaglioa algida]MDK1742760.1 tautomerase family protein [Dellaglioa algida]SOB51277.1 putative tautomerase YolI [Dellaglioa algida]